MVVPPQEPDQAPELIPHSGCEHYPTSSLLHLGSHLEGKIPQESERSPRKFIFLYFCMLATYIFFWLHIRLHLFRKLFFGFSFFFGYASNEQIFLSCHCLLHSFTVSLAFSLKFGVVLVKESFNLVMKDTTVDNSTCVYRSTNDGFLIKTLTFF